MAWKAWERRQQRRGLRSRVTRRRQVDPAEVGGWVERQMRDKRTEPWPFERVRAEDGEVAYRIAGKVYRGRAGDRVVARRPEAVLVRRDYGDASGDGIWRNAVLYDLRAEVGGKGLGWRRYDLAWQSQRQAWRRCAALHAMRRWAPELLAWAEEEVRTWPQTLAERITAAEEVVAGMTHGGEVSAALVRSAAVEPKRLEWMGKDVEYEG